MSNRFRRAMGAALLLLSANALAQALDIPDTLEVREITESDTLQAMRGCNPKVTQEQVDRMRQRYAKNDVSGIGAIVHPEVRSAVIDKRGLWMCVQLSPSRFPIFSLDALIAPARPNGGDPARTKAFFQAIGRSLAETGFARALVYFGSSGNGNALLYAATADRPTDFVVETRFLKKGEFNPEEYAIRLDDPTISGVTTTRIGSGNQVDLFMDRHPKRQVVGGFLVRKGSERTRRFDFSGTTWKSPASLSTTYSFQKEGVMLYRAKNNTAFGSWKVNDGVLYFDINKYTFYSAVLGDNDYLDVEGRRSAAPMTVGNRSGESIEQRYKVQMFQEGNLAAEKEAQEKLDGAVKALQTLIDMRRNEVLAESAADEQRLRPAGEKRQTLCEGDLFGLAMTIGAERDLKAGELCMSYLGPRAEWKATILKEGCKGRCTPF